MNIKGLFRFVQMIKYVLQNICKINLRMTEVHMNGEKHVDFKILI